MFLAGMNQLAVAGTEVVKSLVSNDHSKKNEQALPAQVNSVDSVIISDKAVELSSETSTEMDFKSDDSGTNQKQEQPSGDETLINVLA